MYYYLNLLSTVTIRYFYLVRNLKILNLVEINQLVEDTLKYDIASFIKAS